MFYIYIGSSFTEELETYKHISTWSINDIGKISLATCHMSRAASLIFSLPDCIAVKKRKRFFYKKDIWYSNLLIVFFLLTLGPLGAMLFAFPGSSSKTSKLKIRRSKLTCCRAFSKSLPGVLHSVLEKQVLEMKWKVIKMIWWKNEWDNPDLSLLLMCHGVYQKNPYKRPLL